MLRETGDRKVARVRYLAVIGAAMVMFGCEMIEPIPNADLSERGLGLGLELLDVEAYQSAYILRADQAISLPSSIDLSVDFPLPRSQGVQSSCVGWAVAYAVKSYHERIERGWPLTNDSHVMSPAYVYNQIKLPSGGSYYPDALNLLIEQGVSSWAQMPYDQFDDRTQPSAAARAASANYRIANWGTVQRTTHTVFVQEIKRHLAAKDPVLIGVPVYPDFVSLSEANPIYDDSRGSRRGYHAIVIVGYDDTRSAFKVINSWGTDWGIGGYGWIDYESSRSLIRVAYIAKDAGASDERPDAASDPSPVNAATGVAVNTVLRWTKNARTTSFDVYLGTDRNLGAVDFQGNVAGATFSPDLAPGSKYYWRIDARGAGGVTTGPLWSFTTVGDVQPPHPVPGVTWRGIDSGTSAHLIEVAWNGTRYVAVGIDGTILHSRDGVAWADSGASRGWLRGVASGSTRFVAVGARWSEDASSTIGTIRHSRDGITWTEVRPHLGVAQWSGVAWSGTRFVAVGHGRFTAHSRDGITWTFLDSGTSLDLIGVAWSGAQFVAVANGGTSALHSSDGVTWDWAPGAPVIRDAASNGSRFVAVGNRGGVGAILHSSDGLAWTDVSGAFGNTRPLLDGVAWNGTRFVAVGYRWSAESRSTYGTILHSRDGVTWTEVLLADSGIHVDSIRGVAWNGTRFVAVGSGGTILVSP